MAAWEAGTLTPDDRAVGVAEAHRLAGTLGMFGEGVGSDRARELELQLRQMDAAPTDPAGAARLRGLVGALREQIEAALGWEARARARSPLAYPSEPTAGASAGGPERPGPVVLVADDDDVIAHLLTVALGRRGYAVIRAHDGVEAVELVRTRPVDLVFMDIQMPRMDGLEACRALRNDPRHAALPIVVMTAQGGSGGEPAGLAAGATACLAKPFSVSHVRELARTWAGRAHGG